VGVGRDTRKVLDQTWNAFCEEIVRIDGQLIGRTNQLGNITVEDVEKSIPKNNQIGVKTRNTNLRYGDLELWPCSTMVRWGSVEAQSQGADEGA
jgi:hypothetical protein